MVTRILFLLGIVSLFAAACGGGGEPAATATRAPSSIATSVPTAPSGPTIVVEPRSGPPGTEVTVRGIGWEPGVLIDVTGELAAGATAEPFETVLSGQDGSFSARFRLEAAPDGTTLETGRYNLIARSPASEVSIPFLVETRRPVGASGPQG